MDSRVIRLMGTRHDYHGLGPGWTRKVVDEFIAFMAACVERHGPELIGEEASSESVEFFADKELGGSSAVERWCQARFIEYFAFDLTDAECAEAGIPSSLDAKLALNDGKTDLADNLALARFEGRERRWL